MTVNVELPRLLSPAAATTFPSMEYADEIYHEDVSGMTLIRPPVWRSQVVSPWP